MRALANHCTQYHPSPTPFTVGGGGQPNRFAKFRVLRVLPSQAFLRAVPRSCWRGGRHTQRGSPRLAAPPGAHGTAATAHVDVACASEPRGHRDCVKDTGYNGR